MISPLNPENIAEGRVIRANERGFVLEDCEDSWLNISRYAKPAPKLPQVGERVRCQLDAQGYVRSIERLADEERTSYQVEDGVDVEPPEEPWRQVGRTTPTVAEPAPDRDVQIRRMNALSTATAILSSGGQRVDLGEVTALAEILERWICRG
jgi:hypothetical protein